MHILWPIPSLFMHVSNPNVHHHHKTQSNHKTHQSPSLQVDTKFSIISAFVDRCDENYFIFFVSHLYGDCEWSVILMFIIFPNLEVPVHAHVDQLVSNTCKSATHHVQEIEYFWWICIMFRSSIVRFMFCLNSLALKGSVEDADESNEGDEKEPPPKNQENLE